MSSAKKTLYMETTAIGAGRTAGEITSELVKAGASQVSCEYESGKIVGLRWTMNVGNGVRLFTMPARVEPVFKILNGRRKSTWERANKASADREQAERVAWRQLLRWVQAQLAMIDCGMTEAAEVFFPYMETSHGGTIYALFKEQEFKALTAPAEKPELQ